MRKGDAVPDRRRFRHLACDRDCRPILERGQRCNQVFESQRKVSSGFALGQIGANRIAVVIARPKALDRSVAPARRPAVRLQVAQRLRKGNDLSEVAKTETSAHSLSPALTLFMIARSASTSSRFTHGIAI